jgi:hypothetical protein
MLEQFVWAGQKRCRMVMGLVTDQATAARIGIGNSSSRVQMVGCLQDIGIEVMPFYVGELPDCCAQSVANGRSSPV